MLPTTAYDKAQAGDWEGALKALFEVHPDITDSCLTMIKANLRKVPPTVKTVGEFKLWAGGTRTWGSIHSYDIGKWAEPYIQMTRVNDSDPVQAILERATECKEALYGKDWRNPDGLLDQLSKVYIPKS